MGFSISTLMKGLIVFAIFSVISIGSVFIGFIVAKPVGSEPFDLNTPEAIELREIVSKGTLSAEEFARVQALSEITLQQIKTIVANRERTNWPTRSQMLYVNGLIWLLLGIFLPRVNWRQGFLCLIPLAYFWFGGWMHVIELLLYCAALQLGIDFKVRYLKRYG
jgi:hypothetical protein